MAVNVSRSTRKARTDTTSNADWYCWSRATSWKRSDRTAAFRPKLRAASRRNAAFRDFDSTINKDGDPSASASGIAGDPPPEPRSASEEPLVK